MVDLHSYIERKTDIRFLRLHVVLFAFAILCSCNNDKVENVVFVSDVTNPREALELFETLSPDSGAIFYAMNREKLPFLDSLYEENIIPALDACNYYELKAVVQHLKGTKFENTIQTLFEDKKDELLAVIEEELDSNLIHEQQIFTEIVMPAISFEVDSLLNEDVKKSMEDYAGGFLSYKKFFFFFGRNKDDFKEFFWKNFDLEKYENLISKHISSYFDMIGESQNEYCKELTGKTCRIDYAPEKRKIKAGLSKPTVKLVHQYTEDEKNGMATNFLKDWVASIAIGAVTGGIGWVVTAYDVGNLGYDVIVSIDEMKEMKPSPDERISYIVENDLAYQISQFYLLDCQKT